MTGFGRSSAQRVPRLPGGIPPESRVTPGKVVPLRRHSPAPTQLFQPLSQLIPGRFANIAMFTVWAVDSQEGQQMADGTVMMGAGCEHHGLIALESGASF